MIETLVIRLRAAEERYRSLVEQLPAVVYVDAVDDIADDVLSAGFPAASRFEVLPPVGPLPAEIQVYTVYAGAMAANPRDAAAAQALLASLRAPASAAVLKAKGMEAP
mgnify:CR=1 FL=1